MNSPFPNEHEVSEPWGPDCFLVTVNGHKWPVNTVGIYSYFCSRCDETDRCAHAVAVATYVADKKEPLPSWKE